MAEDLTAAALQAIAKIVHGRNIWFVDGNIGSSGAGGSWGTAFKTVDESRAACSAGDAILIHPWSEVYAEEVDFSSKANLKIVGGGLQTHLSTASGSALTIGSGTHVLNMQLTTTDAGGALAVAALKATSATDVVLQKLKLTGKWDAVLGNGATRLRMDRCHAVATYDAINIQSAEEVLITNCVFKTDGSFSANNDARAVYAGAVSADVFIGSGILRNCLLTSWRTAETAKAAAAFGLVSSGSHYLLQDCVLISIQDHASSTGAATGVSAEDGTGSDGDVSLVGGHIHTRHDAAGTEYHLSQASGVLSVDGTYYDKTKTLGTITHRGADLLQTETLIDGKTIQQALRYIAATAAGLLPSGAGSGTETFKGLDESTDRVQFTTDASGNRTAVSYDP